jgi:APA family basic amino acid/polyamine antiporter
MADNSATGQGERKALGLAACTALVVGNMVGSGFFLAPAALAPYGSMALVGWVVMAVGAICLGLVFARLAHIMPATGGPYAYTRLGFGHFAGFAIAWGYWISIWSSQPAVALALVGYLQFFFPGLRNLPMLGIAIAVAAIWLVTLINLHGVRTAGAFMSAAVYAKLVPFAGVAIFGLVWVDWKTLLPINPTGQPFFTTLSATAPLTMFAFLGLESATVPAGDVDNPHRTIPLATVLGTLISTALYVFGTLVVMGVVPRDRLVQSTAPFADAARLMWGEGAAAIIALAAIVSSLAALNGWTLLLAQVPMAAARDGALPAVFGQLSRRGVPARGLVLSVSLSTALLLLQASGVKGLTAIYDFIVELATDAEMVPYVFCCLVEAMLFATRHPRSRVLRLGPYMPAAVVAFTFSMWTIYGAGPGAGMWELLLILLGLPVYVFLRGRMEPTPVRTS